MSQRVTYTYDPDRDDFEIRLERIGSPVPHKVLCRASSLALAQHKARRRAEQLKVPWVSRHPVAERADLDDLDDDPIEQTSDTEPAATEEPRDYPSSARDLVALIESGDLTRAEVESLQGSELEGKGRKTVLTAISAALEG